MRDWLRGSAGRSSGIEGSFGFLSPWPGMRCARDREVVDLGIIGASGRVCACGAGLREYTSGGRSAAVNDTAAGDEGGKVSLAGR